MTAELANFQQFIICCYSVDSFYVVLYVLCFTYSIYIWFALYRSSLQQNSCESLYTFNCSFKKKRIVAYCLDMKAGSFSEYCQPFLFPRPQELQASTSGFASDLIITLINKTYFFNFQRICLWAAIFWKTDILYYIITFLEIFFYACSSNELLFLIPYYCSSFFSRLF